jgi:YVTN family beta-propeller protein
MVPTSTPRTSTRRRLVLVICALTAALYGSYRLSARPAQNETLVGLQSGGTIFVPTGQTLAPAGKNITFDGRPVDMALRPDGKLLAVMLPTGVKLFDTTTAQFTADTLSGAHSFGGIVWSRDGNTLYATGKVSQREQGSRGAGAVLVTHFDAAGHPTQQAPMTFKLESHITPNFNAKDAVPAGLALSPDGNTLYVSLFNNSTLAAVDLSSYDAATGAAKYTEAPVGSSPERVVVGAGGDKIYVANRGGKKPDADDKMDSADPVVVDPETYKVATGTVSVVQAAQFGGNALPAAKSIPVGLQPADLALSPDGKHLFAANANNDSVSVVDTGTDQVVETVPTSPAPQHLGASSPNGLAVTGDGSTLYVTLGGDNAVEVVTLDTVAGGKAGTTQIAGLIPTAWFPLGVTLSADGANLYIANSKGIGSLGATVMRPRSQGATLPEAGPGGALGGDTYSGHSVYAVLGSIGMVPVPDTKTLAQMTMSVAQFDHFDRMAATLKQTPDPLWSHFKHVILVIKENRTYDQVFGDIKVPGGHIGGDPHLVMFGEQVTPNHHALAHEFGLFDNLYCTGTISADGHHWLNEAFADDYDERAMNVYPRSYPCCGTDPLAYAGNKFIWQAAMDAGITFRNYGEFAPLPSIKRHSSADYNGHYDVTADRNEDVTHAERILADLEEKDGKPALGLPQFTTVWFPNDHTSGTSPGAYTPEADVADNDLAVGKLVDAITHSKKYWQDEPTLIFVVEDDAQGGLDHVEGHRTVGLVVSPYNKRHQIISTNYNQLNMLRTIEMVLGLKPLNQFDAAAVPMRDVFQSRPNYAAYTQEKNRIALNLRNPSLKKLTGEARHWAAVSAQLDFSKPDLADPELVTAALWHHTHTGESYPPVDAAIH